MRWPRRGLALVSQFRTQRELLRNAQSPISSVMPTNLKPIPRPRTRPGVAAELRAYPRKQHATRTIRPEQINLADDIHLARDGWPSARGWTRYRDPQLDALIERALADAPTMGTARTRVAVAKSDVELVSAGSNLQVVALAVLDQEHVSANGFLSAFALNAPQFGLSGPWYTEGIVGLGASLNVDI
jgi:outer membrane protein TolC